MSAETQIQTALNAMQDYHDKMAEARRQLVAGAHERLKEAGTADELKDAVNFLYWWVPELDVANVRCAAGLTVSQLRMLIDPLLDTAIYCEKEGCEEEIPARTRTHWAELKANHGGWYRSLYCPTHEIEDFKKRGFKASADLQRWEAKWKKAKAEKEGVL